MSHQYHTQKAPILLKEYGRNIENLVNYVKSVEDREKRNQLSKALIELMRQIHPQLKDSKDTQENQKKLWDDLYIISNFELDVDSEFPLPEQESIGKKPQRLAYNDNKILYKHYGKGIEFMLEKAKTIEDPEEKFGAIVTVGRLMKYFYLSWNKDNVEPSLIIKHIEQMLEETLSDENKQKIEEHRLFDYYSVSEKKSRPNNNKKNTRRRKRN